MKSLVLWSSRTGNTKAIAEAVYEALPGEKDIFEEGRQPSVDGYDLIFVGFWGFRRGADFTARRTIESLHGKKVAIFATAGTYPDSQAARDYLDNAAALLRKIPNASAPSSARAAFIPSTSESAASTPSSSIR